MRERPVDITVLMPVYNMEQYIDEAIRSVLAQTFTDFELLIVNDGSTDGTVNRILSYRDDRIVLLYVEHGGISAALNAGLAAAKGKYIARFDADDLCDPNRLQAQYAFLENHPDHVLTGSDAVYMMEDGDHLFDFHCAGHTDEDIRTNLSTHCPVIHSAAMFRKEPVTKLGGYSLHAHNFEDHLLWVQLAAFGKMHNISEPLISVRFNPASVTIDEKWRGKRFRQLKQNAIHNKTISAAEGAELLSILRKQDVQMVKQGAYQALCGKKFLTDNYQPARARIYFKKNMTTAPMYLESYLLYLVSFLPQSLVRWLHKRSRNFA